MICSACPHANEGDARFCEQCGQPLDTVCPACGAQARADSRFCRMCGQNLSTPPESAALPPASATQPGPSSSLDAKLDQLQRYLPSHLTEKILANRGRLEGERKLVTVLFTVSTHVRNILTKTGCANRTEAAAYAMRHGLSEA